MADLNKSKCQNRNDKTWVKGHYRDTGDGETYVDGHCRDAGD